MYLFCVPNKKIICQGCLIIFLLIGFVSNTATSYTSRTITDLIDLVSPSRGATQRSLARRRAADERRRTPIADLVALETNVGNIRRNIGHRNRAIMNTRRKIRSLERDLPPMVQKAREICPSENVTITPPAGYGYNFQYCVHNGERIPLTRQQLKQYDEARNRQVELRAELRREREYLSRLTGDIEGLDDRLTDTVPKDAMETERQEAMIEALALQAKVSELDADLGDIDKVLDEVERLYDRTVLGAYMQDKIGQLLNSQVICAARKRCATGDSERIDPKKIQDELFPTSTRTRGSYYDHERLRKIREGGTAN